jgi:RNA polymerase sigma factor (sigma-70 family)
MGVQGRSPLLRLQSDDRLIALVRRGNGAAFEVLVSRYHSRLLAFCRHLLGSREDAEDVLQEVLASAYNAILADNRPINVRPWLYRIARNRSLNHLRRIQAVGVDSMDVHLSENGATTADKVHDREEFRLLMGDIQNLPETQRTALVLREMDALSYEQIAEAMETTVPSVKSLLVRARISLAEAAEARMLSCDEVRVELAEVAEGLQRRPGSLVRRHLRACRRCSAFRVELRNTNKALTALLPISPLVLVKKFALAHLGHHAGAGSSAGGAAAGSTAAAGTTFTVGSGGGLLSAGVGAIATKAVAGLAAAALVTAGAVEVVHLPSLTNKPHARGHQILLASPFAPALIGSRTHHVPASSAPVATQAKASRLVQAVAANKHASATAPQGKAAIKPDAKHTPGGATRTGQSQTSGPQPTTTQPGRTQTQTDPTVLPSQPSGSSGTDPGSGTTPTAPGSGTTPTDGSSSTPPSSPSTGSSPSGGSSPSDGSGTSGSSGTSNSSAPSGTSDQSSASTPASSADASAPSS